MRGYERGDGMWIEEYAQVCCGQCILSERYRELQRQHDALLHAATRVVEQRDMAEARLAEFLERDGSWVFA